MYCNINTGINKYTLTNLKNGKFGNRDYPY